MNISEETYLKAVSAAARTIKEAQACIAKGDHLGAALALEYWQEVICPDQVAAFNAQKEAGK